MHRSRHLLGVAAAALLVASLVGLATRHHRTTEPPARPGAVTIAGFAFTPATIEVRVGSTVTWTNTDHTAHTVNGEAAGSGLASGSIAEGETYRHRFDEPGTYAYFCSFHPFMKGTVVVDP